MATLLSRATITTVGLSCKAFLNLGLCSIVVTGLPILLDALESRERNMGRGVVTVSNHISTLDDPVTWGILPARYFLSSRTTRWTLGASDIVFTNPVFSAFFRQGQVLETFRGKGVYQPAVDIAIEKLNQGGWVHLYGEGKVNPPTDHVASGGIEKLPRFKWGVGRIIMEAKVPPIVVPMWLTGFDKLMPLGRPFPYNYIPRLGAHLSVTFGSPLPVNKIEKALRVLGSNHAFESSYRGLDSGQEKMSGWMGDKIARMLHRELEHEGMGKRQNLEVMKVRSEVTAIVQRGVEALGRSTKETYQVGRSAPREH